MRIVIFHFTTMEQNMSGTAFTHTKNGLHNVGTARTDETRHAQNFPSS
ncbi:Uncharacterised protein [Vibrio cholerae]|uniref:Uncharacterized protein n=1 Tax=Vibrio cholerae TaxID=666 RepID=A0A655ZDN8_VIBCL|nr:Uncharacterised protein [Vibrio cholerae]CSD79226.1 Uncharacterised protein [Vibrio cholerae]